jgi:hypothetical protein
MAARVLMMRVVTAIEPSSAGTTPVRASMSQASTFVGATVFEHAARSAKSSVA